MNIASGQSSKKEHLIRDSKTECNRHFSTSVNDYKTFKWVVENYPATCCQVCLTRFKEKESNKK